MKVYFKTSGCRVNQVETQSLMEKFAAAGHPAAGSPSEADLIIVNSCTVTEYADRGVLSFLRKLSSEAGPGARIAVTGCLATLDPARVLEAAPGALIIKNADKERLPELLAGAAAAPDFFRVSGSEGRSRAFVKVQEGCDLRCAYCLVPAARGKISSKPLAAVTAEVAALAARGFPEVVLCGTRLGIYRCPETGAGLDRLTLELCGLPGGFRLRYSSLEPGELTAGLLKAAASCGDRFCDYFHLPLQAGSDPVLKAMRRPYLAAAYRGKVEMARRYFPRAGIFCDIIAGFPSETPGDFGEGLAFVEGLGLSGMHVFRFSPRPGTPAASMPRLAPAEVKARSARLLELDSRMRARFAASLAPGLLSVATLRCRNGVTQALASNFAPVALAGEFPAGKLVRAEAYGSAGGTVLAREAR